MAKLIYFAPPIPFLILHRLQFIRYLLLFGFANRPSFGRCGIERVDEAGFLSKFGPSPAKALP
jgi:hypothetical protein